jgi:hypothetical protein
MVSFWDLGGVFELTHVTFGKRRTFFPFGGGGCDPRSPFPYVNMSYALVAGSIWIRFCTYVHYRYRIPQYLVVGKANSIQTMRSFPNLIGIRY